VRYHKICSFLSTLQNLIGKLSFLVIRGGFGMRFLVAFLKGRFCDDHRLAVLAPVGHNSCKFLETYVFLSKNTRFDMSITFFNQLLGGPSAFWEHIFHYSSNFGWNNYSKIVFLASTKLCKIHCKTYIFRTFHVGVLSHFPFLVFSLCLRIVVASSSG